MPDDWTITSWTTHWTTADWWFWSIAATAVAVLLLWSIRAVVRMDLEARFELFVGATQSVMAWTVIHGTFQYFRHVVVMPTHESWLTSAAIESVMWVGAGMILIHGQKPNTTGWGYGGPVFLAAGSGGAILSVLASEDWRQAVGRIVIVVLGMWTLVARLMKATRRTDPDAAPSRWSLRYWRARRSRYNPREWEIRTLARAIRRSNSIPPIRWIGQMSLTRRAEGVQPDVLAEARRRAALVRAMRSNAAWTAPVMVRMIEEANEWTGATGGVWAIDGPGPDHPVEPGPMAALDRHGPRRNGPRSSQTKTPRTIRGELADHSEPDQPDRSEMVRSEGRHQLAVKVASVKAHVGEAWPDVNFSGDKIMAMKLPGCRNKTTANALAALLNEMAETERARRFDPLTH